MGWPGPLTGRQYQVWLTWAEGEWNTPDRSDYYAMQVTAALRLLYYAVLHKDPPGDLKVGDFIIKFTRQKGAKGVTKEQATAFAKARWRGIIEGAGRKPNPRTKPPAAE